MHQIQIINQSGLTNGHSVISLVFIGINWLSKYIPTKQDNICKVVPVNYVNIKLKV